MYNGVISLLLGESWFFFSLDLLKYSVAVLAAFHLFIVLYEERTLESRFGDAYRSYCKAVPRWGFTIHPFPETRCTT
jgi:protein-S-isoprenylcysteine O-methyltransferase Ste14